MGEACEKETVEIGRLRIELERVREELRKEREGAEGTDLAETEERGDGGRNAGKLDGVEMGLESLMLDGGA